MTIAIRDVFHLRDLVNDGKYAHGGYPKYYVTEDGGVLSHKAVKDNLGLITECMENGALTPEDKQWAVAYCEINWEDSDLWCDHEHERIPSAYAEDEVDPWQDLRNRGLVPT